MIRKSIFLNIRMNYKQERLKVFEVHQQYQLTKTDE